MSKKRKKERNGIKIGDIVRLKGDNGRRPVRWTVTRHSEEFEGHLVISHISYRGKQGIGMGTIC